MKKVGKKKGGAGKIGRSKRIKDNNLSAFIRGKITGEQYLKSTKK